MSQVSLIRVEARGKGAKRTIKLPAIPAGGNIQYTKNHSKLKGVVSEYGYFNQITIMNNGAIDVEIALDYTKSKTYPIPAVSSISLDEVIFQEFDVNNMDAVAPTIADKITIIAGFERSTLREPIKSKKEIYRRGF